MAEERDNPGSRGLSDALREAVEKTVTASAEALDDVSRRGREARDSVSQRGQEASASVASRVAEAAEGMRPATREELRDLEQQLAELARRVAKLEAKPKVDP